MDRINTIWLHASADDSLPAGRCRVVAVWNDLMKDSIRIDWVTQHEVGHAPGPGVPGFPK
jgi:hypothetical protein